MTPLFFLLKISLEEKWKRLEQLLYLDMETKSWTWTPTGRASAVPCTQWGSRSRSSLQRLILQLAAACRSPRASPFSPAPDTCTRFGCIPPRPTDQSCAHERRVAAWQVPVLTRVSLFCLQPMFSVAPSLATNASAAFNPYLGPVSPGLVPAEILPTAPMLVAGNPGVPVPAAAAAAAQKLMRTDRLEVGAQW